MAGTETPFGPEDAYPSSGSTEWMRPKRTDTATPDTRPSSVERTRTPASSISVSTGTAFPRHPTAFGKTPDDGSGCATAFCDGDH